MKEKLLTLTLLLILPMAVSRASAKTSGITDIPDSIPRSVVHYQDGVPYIETTMVPYVDEGMPEQNHQTSSQSPRKANTGNTWTIGSGGNFSDINAAMSDSRVAAGDVLELKPGTILKGDQTINKAIHLKGNGYQMDSDGNLASNVAQIQGYLYINAEGTCVSNLAISMFIDGNGSTIIPYLIVYSSQVVIEGCYINGKIIGHANNATIRQCFFRSLDGGNYSGWLIQNNIIASQYSNGYNLITGLNNATINHNTVYSIFSSSHTSNYLITSSVSSCTITNNIIVHFPSNNNYAGTYNGTIESASLTNNTVSRNVFSGSSPNSSNRGGVNAIGDIFDYSKYVSSLYKVVYYDACFHLVAGSPAAGYATDGGDCGPWSGAYPYVVGGTVGNGGDDPNPTFHDGDVFTAQTAEGVEMTFKVISASEKTCQVGIGDYDNTCIDKTMSGIITIPETVKGLTVTSIGNYAFNFANSLTTINIPNSVTSIGYAAFQSCSSLKSIKIPSAIVSIAGYTFVNCHSLTSINIPISVRSIGESAFQNCRSLSSINIPKFVLNIEQRAFSGCGGLTSISVDTQNPMYDSRNNCNAIIESASNTLIQGCSNSIIPNSVTTIGSSAFYGCSSLNSIIIPNSITTIGRYAFNECIGLTSIVLPVSLDVIEDGLFSGCSSLSSVNIPNNVKSIGSFAFYKAAFSTITIPSSVENISSYAFCTCSNLTSIVIPDNVTQIGSNAFSSCTNLASISIPDTPITIGSEAFNNTKWYQSYPVGIMYIGHIAYGYKGTMSANTKLVLDSSTLGLAESAFSNQTNLVSIEFSKHLTSISSNAFSRSGLTSVIIPDNIKDIGYGAFQSCESLISLSIHGSKTTIGDYAFYNCTKLSIVNLPDDLANIGNYAFDNTAWYNEQPDGVVYIGNELYKYKGTMPSNTSITIKEGTTRILRNAFFNCTGLISITIPGSVESIDEDAFFNCSSIKSITLPEGLIHISKDAFSRCYGLSSLTIPASVSDIELGAFNACYNLTSIGVNVNNKYYDSRNNCNAIIHKSTNSLITGCRTTIIPNDIITIADYAFESNGCPSQLAIPEGVIRIGDDAFYGNGELKTISFPNTLKEIGYRTFCFCSGLRSLVIPFNITKIGGIAFANCTSISEVTSEIRSPFTTGSEAFKGLPSDATLYVPAGTVAQYSALADWNRFTNIIEGDNQEPEAYAVLSPDQTSLSFYFDGNKSNKQGTVYTADQFRTPSGNGWSSSASSINTVTFDPSFADFDGVTSTSCWFSNCSNLKVINEINNLNTGNVTDMSYMFSGCRNLTSLDVSRFNTGNAKFMYYMFYNCSSLTDLDVKGFNTENALTMLRMFGGCSNLTNLDLSNFKTDKVQDMTGMFQNCKSLKKLDLSGWNTKRVMSMDHNTNPDEDWGMFSGCSSLITIKVGEDWNTDNVTSSAHMFNNCVSIVGGDGTKFNPDFIDKTKAYAGPGGYLTMDGQEVEDHDYDWSIGSGGDFADVNSAMKDERVKDGHVLQILKGTEIGSNYITKAVTVVGNGYEDTNDGYVSGIYIDCANVTIKDLYTGYIYVRHNDATIERCRANHITGADGYESEDITIRGCFVLGWIYSNPNDIAWGWNISNNIIISNNYDGNTLDYLAQATIDHNLIINYKSNLNAVGGDVTESSFTNNIIITPSYSVAVGNAAVESAEKFEYNIVTNTNITWPTNITGYNSLAKLFVCNGSNTTDAYYKLISGSPAIGYSNDKGNCGPWSGIFPYWLNGKEPDATLWKLDPNIVTDTQYYEFATLDDLMNYLLNGGRDLKKSVTVSVADAEYTMDMIPYRSDEKNMWNYINYVYTRIAQQEEIIVWIFDVFNAYDVTISMEAPQKAVFQFNLLNSHAYQEIPNIMQEAIKEMLAQGMTQEEVDKERASWEKQIAEMKDRSDNTKERFAKLFERINTTNIIIRIDDKIIIDPFVDPTQWKLDPTLTTDTERYEFATLDALFNFMLSPGSWYKEGMTDMTVSVADATYTMDLIPNINTSNFGSVDEMIKYMYYEIEPLRERILAAEEYYRAYNITFSMEALHEAIFQFNLQYSQAYRVFQAYIAAKIAEMQTQGMTQEEIEAREAQWFAQIKEYMYRLYEAMLKFASHIKTTNIIIFLDNTRINPDPDSIEPNDLLALKNIYNMLGGSSWTNKKWKINDYGAKKEDFPGVTFDDEGYVVEINLENNNLRGTINPTGWTWQLCLPRLTGLYLQKNNISGDLSPWLKGVNRGDRLKALDMSYNNLTEISDSIPSSITSLNLENQNREWYRPDGVYTDPLKIEAMSDMTPIRLYLSANQTVVMPSLFTYNHKSQTHSARPTIYIINAEGIDKYGYFKSSGEDTYSLAWKDNEYTEKQNAPCYVRFDNPYGSVYPAYLRYIEGDANMSGYTDVLDVQTTLNYVLNGGGVWQFNRSAANTYEDNLINVQDIVCMVNIVLNNEAVAEGIILNTSSSRRHLRRAADAMDAQGWLYTEKGRVMLTTVNEVGAIDLELKGVSTSQVSLLLNHSQYQMIGRNTEEGSRYVIFSPTGQPIPASEEVALLAVSSQTELIGAQAADMEAQELELAIGQPTGLEAIDNGQLTNDNAPIYNVAGQRLSKMQRGINITNGRKVLK